MLALPARALASHWFAAFEAMALFIDSQAVFDQRLLACGVPQQSIDLLKAAGVEPEQIDMVMDAPVDKDGKKVALN